MINSPIAETLLLLELLLLLKLLLKLGEERASLSAFPTFVWFALVWFCLFSLPLGVWEGLRFVIVALPGLFSYLSFVLLLKLLVTTLEMQITEQSTQELPSTTTLFYLTPTEVGNILSWRLIMKYFLRSFSPFRWFKKGSCQFLAKECAQYWLTAKRTKPVQ